MSEIRSSFYAIAVVSVVVGIIDVFDGADRLKKHTQYIVSLVVVIALIIPMRNMFLFFPNALNDVLQHMQTDETADVENQVQKTYALGISKKISEYFSVPDTAFNTEIEIQSENGENIINKIKITILDKNYFHLCEKIEAYIGSSFGCEVSVIQSFGED